MADARQHHVAVLHPKWLDRFTAGEKRAELRIGKRRPLAAKAQPGDVVHLRAVGKPCSIAMDVVRVLDLGYCDRAAIASIRARYGKALGLTAGEPTPYLDDHPGGFAVLVFLDSARPSVLRQAPRFQPWAVLKR